MALEWLTGPQLIRNVGFRFMPEDKGIVASEQRNQFSYIINSCTLLAAQHREGFPLQFFAVTRTGFACFGIRGLPLS